MTEVLPSVFKEVLKKGTTGVVLEKKTISVVAETSEKALKIFKEVEEDSDGQDN